MTSNQYTEFKDEKLIPTLLDSYLDKAFEDMHFSDRGSKWTSPYHIDGKASSSKDQTYIYKRGYKVHDNNGDSIALFDFAMQYYKADFMGTLQKLADVCGLTLPETDEEYRKAMQQSRQRQDSLLASRKRMEETLLSPEGFEVLNYLLVERGYSPELVKAMGLGYLSAKEAESLNAIGERLPKGITDFPLAIPYESMDRLRGFKFRYISDEAKAKYGKGKYRNTESLNGKMNSLPYGYSPKDVKEDIIVVEGELDALHPKAKGLKNIIATSGGSLSDEALTIIMEKSRDLKRVIFIPDQDADGRGAQFVETSIPVAEEKGLTSFVVTLPDGYKDVDSYLCKNSIESLRALIDEAQNSAQWRYNKILSDTQKKYPEDSLSELHYAELEDKIFKLANSIADEPQRLRILTDFSHITNVPNYDEALRAKADRLREAEDARLQKEATMDAIRKAQRLSESGKVVEALSVMEDATKHLSEINRSKRYSALLEDDTESIFNSYRVKPTGIKTNIELSRGGESYTFTLPSGGLTIVAAPTGHGKSKLLQSLAIDTAKGRGEGDTLYLTYEENKESVTKQLLNAFANVEIRRQTAKHGNLEAISQYLYNGSTEYISGEGLNLFKPKLDEFKSLLHSQRLKVIKPEDNYLRTLIDTLEFYLSKRRVEVIFIDYVQELYIEGYKTNGRTDELKEIMIQIDLIAQRHNIPIVLAAQLNRETDSPLSMSNQNLADSGWIERKASEILLLWSNKEKCKGDTDGKKTKRVNEELPNLQIGEGGKVYVTNSKSRYIPTGLSAILTINPNTGRIEGNRREESTEAKRYKLAF